MNVRLAQLATLLLPLTLALPAHAERADRDKPMVLEANRISIDDARKTQVLEGDVMITKGTLVLRADRIVISEDPHGFQKGTAFGSKQKPARFRQKREARDDYIEGEAERIEYDTRTEVAELFQRAWVKSGNDEVRGDYIRYDALSEKYLVTAGEKRGATTAPTRVRAIIQPRAKNAPADSGATGDQGIELRNANALGTPDKSAPAKK